MTVTEDPFNEDQPEKAAQPPVKGKFTWTVYYKSKEGFGESVVIATDSAKELQNARGGMVLWLQMIEAETQPRDKEGVKTAGWGRAAAPAAPKPGATPAPNGGGATPVCNTCGGATVWRSGIAGPNAKNPGKEYGFYSCANFPTCRGKAA